MRVGSLFSGCGLGDLGLTQAGMEIVFQVEIEPYARKVLELRWPDVPKFGDIREVKGSDTPPCDLLAGGFPCQDISTAGKGAGITGARSGLWKEMYRLIFEIRPRYVLVENVTALLGRGLGVVLGDLAEIGYDCEWDCIPASAVGAPHRRDRVWIIAHTRLFGQKKHEVKTTGIKQLANSDSSGLLHGQIEIEPTKRRLDAQRKFQPSSSEVAYATSAGRKCRQRSKGHRPQSEKRIFGRLNPNGKSDWWVIEPNVGRVAHGVPSRVDRLKGLGNGQVVQVVEYVGRQILAHNQRIIK